MAIQIRRGTNTEWENNNSNIVVGEPAIVTDAERFFVGTASGDYAEFANLDIIAPAYDTSTSYVVGDVINRHGKLYSCNTPCSGTFNASYWDEKSLAEILKDLESEINYAQYEIGYASGELITINNGASEIPVKDLTLDIEATQDLHGYDHPWVGGAGKNLLPIVDTPTYSGLTIIKNNDGSYNISGKPNGNGSIEFYNDVLNPIRITEPCIFTSGWNPKGNATFIFSTAESSIAIQSSNSDTLNIPIGEYTRFRIYVNSANTYNFTFKPMVRLASVSDATFEPYTNICPISGWDEVNVSVAGKNLFCGEIVNRAFIAWPSVHIVADVSYRGFYTRVVGGNTYTVSRKVIETNRFRMCATVDEPFDNTPAIILSNDSSNDSQYSITVTVPSGYNYLFVYLSNQSDTCDASNYQIEAGSTATEIVPNGQTYTIDLDGTRYGGTLDVTTGVLTITHGFVTLDGTTNWSMGTAAAFRYFDASMSALNANSWETNVLSNMFNQQGTYPYVQIGGAKKIRVCYSINDTSVTTVAQLQALLTQNALQVLYPLATPQVVQLTPTQVHTVLGTNNLWNQMNSNNELAYRISNALN